MYVNGIANKNDSSCFYHENGLINVNLEHEFGEQSGSTSNDLDGYLAEINFIDGQNLTHHILDTQIFKQEYGDQKSMKEHMAQNGFHLDFSDNSSTTATTIGKDTSGNQITLHQ